MDPLSGLAEGFRVLGQGGPLLWTIVGVFIGTAVGVLPGVGPLGAMAVLLPLSFRLDTASGVLMLAGIFYGSMYGGTITSVLLNIPGESTSVMTAIEGHRLTLRGRAGAALAIGAFASFVAGSLSVLLLSLAAPAFSQIAIRFAPPEVLALTIFALLVLSRLTGGSLSRALLAVSLGLLLGAVGVDQATGNIRMTFGYAPLGQGINLTSVAVGIFAFAELFRVAVQRSSYARVQKVPLRELYPTWTEFRRSVPAIFRGGILGFFIGLIPGPAAVMSTFSSYGIERRFSKGREEFGRGAIEGVAGPEAANNGAVGGMLVPLISLGIPFSAVTALLLAAYIVHGVTPGPLFISQQPTLFWSLIAGMYVGNLALLILNVPLIGMFVSLLRLPRELLIAIVLVVAILGVFGTRNTMFDVWVLILMGVVGYWMIKLDISRPALLLGFILSDVMERTLRQTLSLARGDITYFLGRPITMTILTATLLVLLAPVVVRFARRRLGRAAVPAREASSGAEPQPPGARP